MHFDPLEDDEQFAYKEERNFAIACAMTEIHQTRNFYQTKCGRNGILLFQ